LPLVRPLAVGEARTWGAAPSNTEGERRGEAPPHIGAAEPLRTVWETAECWTTAWRKRYASTRSATQVAH